MSTEPRFKFGRIWQHCLSGLDQRRFEAHQPPLTTRFGLEGLPGERFLGAKSSDSEHSKAPASLDVHITSFDYDSASVVCARTLHSQVPKVTWDVNQSELSKRWTAVKLTCNKHLGLRLLSITGARARLRGVKPVVVTLRDAPWKCWHDNHSNHRGIFAEHDLIDCAGGYLFETTKPEQVFRFFRNCCRELVFRRCANAPD